MIWFIAALAITLVVTVREHLEYRDGLCTAMALFVTGIMSALVAFVIGLLAGTIAYDAEPRTYTFPVVAAQDGSSVHGRFSIFGGYIEEEPYYFFYREHADGGIYQGKIRANDTLIYEDQETQNYIEVSKCDTSMEFWGMSEGCETTYEIHVPEGSVDRDVNFDLE